MSQSEFPTRSPVPTASGYPFYKYERLPSKHHIRRLLLKPGQEDDLLCGTMELVDLDNGTSSGSYETISYVWGSAVMDHWILVDGFQLPITGNLFYALRQTRDPKEVRMLWADSICIWQENKEEKGQQVSLMTRIYKTSRCTLICLGFDRTDEEGIRTAADVASLVDEVDKMIQQVFDNDDFSWDEDSFPRMRENDPLIFDARWNAWDKMILLPWFSRGWVVQEAASRPEASVLWEKTEIKWSRILRVNYWLNMRVDQWIPTRRHIPRLHADQYELRQPKECYTFWEFNKHFEPGTTLDILTGGRRFELSVESDRIHAFMGLPTSDGRMNGLRANYEDEKMDVYRDFAVQYLENHGDLDFLTCVEHDDDTTLDQKLPWVPRWDCGRRSGSWYDSKINKIIDVFAENEGCDKDKSFPFINGDVLTVKGLIIDMVQWASKEIEFHALASDNVQEVVMLWEEVKVQSTAHPGPHRSQLSLAFLNALVKGKYEGGYDVWCDNMKRFAQLLQPDSHGHPMSTDIFMHDRHALYYSGTATKGSRGRRFILLGHGNYGIAPKVTHEGDVCAIIFGTQSPFVLRKIAGKENCYKVVGPTEVQSERYHRMSGLPGGLGQRARNEPKTASYDWLLWPEVSAQAQEIMLC